jgi:poly(3-hydroxybutyrate) depolymerase
MNPTYKISLKAIKSLFIFLMVSPVSGFSQNLTNSTSITITKTWSQQPNGYTYPIHIAVPSGAAPAGGFPVCILLHGNGSANLSNLAGPPMIQQFGSVLPCHILIAPTGYENSWNICAENSDAPDVDMINDLVTNLQGYSNVSPTKIRILGTSNGAGLANQVFIENTNPGIDIVCAVVSHLNDFQYHLGDFYRPSGVTNSGSSFCGYDVVSNPLLSTNYLSISNHNDSIIPYIGGASVVGATFLPAESAAFTIATYNGYAGSILTTGTVIGTGPTAITEFSYLSGDVVHLKGSAQHQANSTQKDYISTYFSDCDPVVGMEESILSTIEVYPNPANNILNLKATTSLVGMNYEVCDHLGRTRLSGKIQSENTGIDLTNLAKGMYYLTIEGDVNQVISVIKK